MIVIRRGRVRSRATTVMIQASTCLLTLAQGLVLSPNTLPEQVVQAHLQALKRSDLKSAFQLSSPELIDECPWPSFAGMISEPPFKPIIGHSKADVLMTIHHKGDSVISCLVRIVPSKKEKSRTTQHQPCLQYWWELSKQYQDGPFDGCWMIDSILPDFEDMEFDAQDLVMEEEDVDDDDYENMYFETGF